MRSTDIVIVNGAVTLSGSLTEPAAPPATVVVCLHGSGPVDRDENMPGQRLDVFNTLATALSEVQVATLRYDKRGCGRSTGDYHRAGQEELIADARAVIAEARRRGFTRVVLLGHSEGTIIAARLASAADGLVLLTPFVTPMREILLRQADEMQKMVDAGAGWSGWLTRRIVGLLGGARHAQARLITRIETTTAPVIRHLGRKVEAKNLREHLALDYDAIYRAVRVPVLAIAGAKDVQCPPEDAARIARLVGPLAEAHVIPNLTHLLRLSDAEAGFAAYAAQLAQPPDPALVALVATWVSRV